MNNKLSYTGADKWKQKATELLNKSSSSAVEDILVNGESVVDDDSIANIKMPKNVSELENDAGYIQYDVSNLVNYYLKDDTYTKTEVQQLITLIPQFKITVVETLPDDDISTTTIYLVKTSETETGNLYTEYIYADDKWEKLGTQKLDLTNYYTKAETDNAITVALSFYYTRSETDAAIKTAIETQFDFIMQLLILQGIEVRPLADENGVALMDETSVLLVD